MATDVKVDYIAENRSGLQLGIGQPAPNGLWYAYSRRVNHPWVMLVEAFEDEHEVAQWCRDKSNGGAKWWDK